MPNSPERKAKKQAKIAAVAAQKKKLEEEEEEQGVEAFVDEPVPIPRSSPRSSPSNGNNVNKGVLAAGLVASAAGVATVAAPKKKAVVVEKEDRFVDEHAPEDDESTERGNNVNKGVKKGFLAGGLLAGVAGVAAVAAQRKNAEEDEQDDESPFDEGPGDDATRQLTPPPAPVRLPAPVAPEDNKNAFSNSFFNMSMSGGDDEPEPEESEHPFLNDTYIASSQSYESKPVEQSWSGDEEGGTKGAGAMAVGAAAVGAAAVGAAAVGTMEAAKTKEKKSSKFFGRKSRSAETGTDAPKSPITSLFKKKPKELSPDLMATAPSLMVITPASEKQASKMNKKGFKSNKKGLFARKQKQADPPVESQPPAFSDDAELIPAKSSSFGYDLTSMIDIIEPVVPPESQKDLFSPSPPTSEKSLESNKS